MIRASEFAGLRQFFEGYLHEDFVQEYGSPSGAVRAFAADASKAERQRLRAEAGRLLQRVEQESFAEIRALLARLGARWTPRSRAAVLQFLTLLARDI